MTVQDAPARKFKLRVFQAVLIVALVAILLFGLGLVAEILLVVFAGILVAVFLRGLSTALSKVTPLSDGWALAVVAMGLAGAVGLVGWLLAPEVSKQVEELSKSLPESLRSLRDQLSSTSWGAALVERVSEADQYFSERSALSQARSFLSTTTGALAGFFVILVLGLYMASEPDYYRHGVVRLVPVVHRKRADKLLIRLGDTLHWWLIGQFMSMTLIGILTWIGLLLFGVPLALTLALLAAVLTFIPNVGPIIAVIPAALLAMMDSPMRGFYVLLMYLGIQTVESYLVTPLIQRRTVRLAPALILVSQMVAGTLLGLFGVALATPMVAVLMVVVQKLYVEETLEKGAGEEAGKDPV
ncbi:AI-2E family transporter [Prosthecobacter sp. SYSU 5D2]|uniref:AI-2E family transporter n=1 Tax=Prosthecobacter sp. SYSU 5D2 TaxID=3134134 RepID=UPI0031FF388D